MGGSDIREVSQEAIKESLTAQVSVKEYESSAENG